MPKQTNPARGTMVRKIARHGVTLVATVMLGGFLSATLVRLAPGFDVDEAQLDPHLNSESIRALRETRLEQRNIFRFYFRSLQRAAHGDLGTSISLGQPVTLLLRDRAPLTLRLVGLGLLLSWTAAMALSLSAAWLRVQAYDALTTVISGAFLCIPAAVLALLSVLWNVPGSLAVGLIVFPQVFRYSRDLLAKAYSLPHIVTARAKGLTRKLMGFEMAGRGIGRDGYEVMIDGSPAGFVTSGGPSPTLNRNIGLCYLPVSEARPGRKIQIVIRGQAVDAVTVETPFYKRPK